ncbi:uncharacterized protein LOC121992017 isoform X1 [Zingiber officinale]|uniref:uncharacterized protein LOC121992017 isoform X1 n=1 Tax=Zingiber officinale TaxID=94328 RepID=UPI001C4AB0E9|nr:uncharacterized protein LOC121992017 isoform X1 [Zingiber officinale]
MQTTEKRQAREGYKWRNPAISKDFKPPPPLLLPQSQGLFDSESFLANFIAIGGELEEEAFAESEMVFDHESSLKELNLKNKRVMVRFLPKIDLFFFLKILLCGFKVGKNGFLIGNREEDGRRKEQGGGRRGCGRCWRPGSSRNASSTPKCNGASATCTVSTAPAAPSARSASRTVTATTSRSRFGEGSRSFFPSFFGLVELRFSVPPPPEIAMMQIRRSSYHDVIRVSEIQKVLDISGVQTYIINSARIVFLNERPQPRPGKGVNNTCEVCDRSLLDSFRFCSLGCKIASTGTRTSKKNSPLRRQTTAPVSESEDSFASSSRGSVRMQRSTPSASPPATGARRRKGIPQRAPFSTQ